MGQCITLFFNHLKFDGLLKFTVRFYVRGFILLCSQTDAFIVIRKSALKDVKKTLEEVHPVNINLEYILIADSEESGTADILRHIKDKITVGFEKLVEDFI